MFMHSLIMLDSSMILVVLYLEFLFISCACLYFVSTLFISFPLHTCSVASETLGLLAQI